MNCKTLPSKILFYLDLELDKSELQSFDAHLSQCISCKTIFNSIASTYKIIEIENHWTASPTFYTRLIEKYKSSSKPRSVSIVMNILKPLAVAASISMGILIGNGELEVILTQNTEAELAEGFAPSIAEDYSVWTLLNDEDGN